MKRHGSLNRIYRLVWSRVAHCWVPVAETARARGKGGGKSARRKLVAARLSLTAVTFTSPFALAGPTGGQVVSGTGTISQSGATTTIKQGSQNLSLDWVTFNIAPQETVDFVQPSASAIAVNRIFGTNGSQILGHLDANGQVFLINPNGILFGAGAQVNVGGLVASTLDVTDASSSGNTRTFIGNGSGSVVNQGTINAANGGYVALLGNHVSNQGTVTAQLGTVALGAGSGVTLTFNGNNLVHMQVDQSVLNSLAKNGGLIRADGGTVIMTAGAANALLASVVNNTGEIEARTVQNLGDEQSGTITLLGGMTAGTVDVGGTLDASAPNGGNGGVIETSAANVKVADGAKVTTAAAMGLTGSWSIDPTNFTISSGSASQTTSGIGATTLDTNLGTSSVSITTAAIVNGSDLGDVDINAAVSWSSGNSLTLTAINNVNVNATVGWTSGTLTLNAANNININSDLNGSGFAKLALLYGQGSLGGGTSTYTFNNGAYANLPAGPNFSTKFGSSGSTTDFTVVTSTTALAGMSNTGDTALGTDLTESSAVTPIGPFSGTFDGLGHTVSLNGSGTVSGSSTCNTPNGQACFGLFGEVATGGLIRNIGVTGTVNISVGSTYGGALAAVNNGTIESSYSTAAITMSNSISPEQTSVGGLVGFNKGTISNSYATGAVNSGTYTGNNNIGGLVGNNYGGTINKSYATGSVSGSAYGVGGLVGLNYGGAISGSFATGNVSGTGWVGGLVGKNVSNGSIAATISNSYATGSVSGSSYVGGLVGWNYGNAGTADISTSYATGRVTGSSNAGGLVGLNAIFNGSTTFTSDFWNSSTTNQPTSSSPSGTGTTTTGAEGTTAMQTPSTFTGAGWDLTNTWTMVSGVTYPLLKSFLTPLTATANNATTTYSATSYSGGNGVTYASYGAAVTPSLLVGTTVNYTGSSQGAQNAGSYAITPGGLYSTSQFGYGITYGSGTLTISPAIVNLNGSSVYNGTTTINGSALGSVSTGISSQTVTLTGIGTLPSPNVSAGTQTLLTLGSLTLANGTGAGLAANYTLVGGTDTATITAEPVTVSTSNVTKTYDGTTAASGTAVVTSGTLYNSDTLSGGSYAFTNANAGSGNKTVTVSGVAVTDSGNYALTDANNTTSTINPEPVTVSLSNTTNVTKTYDGTTAAPNGFSPTYSFVGLVAGDSATVGSSATPVFNSAHVATATAITQGGLSLVSITGNGTDNSVLGDYTLSSTTAATGNGIASITTATLTPTLTNSGVTKAYDGTTNAPAGFTPTYSLSGLISGDTTASLTDTGVAYNSAHVASANQVTVSGLSITGITGSDGSQASDYTLAASGASVAASITPVPLAIGLSNVTNVTKTYDGTTAAPSGFSPTYSFSGLVAGDSVTVGSSATPAFNSAHVATATAITQGGLSLTSISGNGSDGSVLGDYTLSSTTAATGGGVASITPASLTPTLTNSGVTKTYDGTTNAPSGFTPTYSYSGLVSGDAGASLTDTGVAYDSAHVASATSVTISGLSISDVTGSNGSQASDYTLASSSASVAATITPLTLTINLSNVADVSKTYDGTTAAPSGFSPTYSYSGLVAGDSATLSTSATPVFNSAHVATATAITQGGLSLTSITGNGSDNSVLSDYTLSSTTAATGVGVASISPLTLTATAPTIGGTLTKTYDGTTAATGASLSGGSVSGALSGDSLSLDTSAVALAYNSSHVLSASSIGASGSLGVDINSSTSGSQSTDYSVALPTISPVAANITPASLTATLTNSGATKTYDGTTNAPAGFTPTYSLSGLISGDTAASLTDTGVAYNSAHVANATDVAVSGLSISGVTGSNGSQVSDYTLASSSASVAATITPLTLTINLSNVADVSKTYDGTTAAPSGFSPTYSFSGLVAGDSATLSSSTTPVFNSAHVATATAITQGGLSLTSITGNGSDNSVLGDYTLSNTTASTGAGVASITPLTLTATAPTIGGALTKVYDGSTAAPGASLSGGSVSGALSGDSLSLDTSAIALAYNSSHVLSASSIGASGSLGVDINSSTSGSQSTDYSVTLPTISPVAANITPASLTSMLTNSGVTKTYDGTTAAPSGFSPTYSFSGLVSGDTGASLTDTSVAYNSAHVVSATDVTVSGLSVSGITGSNGSQASDYALASNSTSVAASITPLTLTATAPTIGGTLTKVYDDSPDAPGASLSGGSVSGALSGDSLSLDTSAISLAYNSSHVVSASSIGASGSLNVDIISSTSGSQSTDYSVTLPTISPVAASITPASLTATLTNSGATKTYDGTTNAPAGFTPTYSFSGLISGDTRASLTDTGVVYNSAHVASANEVTVSGLSIGGITGSDGSQASDYTLASSSASVAASITPASLTINLSNVADVSKTYDGTTAAPSGFSPTYSFAGLVAGDGATLSSSAIPVFNSAHVAAATAITQGGLSLTSITGNGSDNSVLGDYTLSNTTASTGAGVASITPFTLTATAPTIGGTLTKTYDGTTAATGASLSGGSVSGALSGDSLSLDANAITLAYNSSHVLSASSIGANGTLSVDINSTTNGSQSTDYSVALPTISPVAANITPASLTSMLTNSGVTKTYDGTTAAPSGFSPTYSFSGLISGDTAASLTDTSVAYNSAHVVSATDVTVSGLSVSGITGSNGSQASDYALASNSTSVAASITPLTLTATAPTIGGTLTKVYDDSPDAPGASLSGGSVGGALSGDSLSLDTSDITLAYNTAQTTATTIFATGTTSLAITSSTAGSLLSDYNLTQPTIAPVAGTITAAPAPTPVSSGVLPSQSLFVFQASTQPEASPSSGRDILVNDNIPAQQGLSVHVVDGGVRLPDDRVVVNE